MNPWLGHIYWWNVAAEGRPSRVRLEELHSWVQELNLQPPTMPKPAGAHAFRAASGGLYRRYVDDDGLSAMLTTIEVSSTTEFIVRHVMKTATNPRTQQSGSEKVAQLKFYRPTRTSAGRRPGSEVSKPTLKPGLAGKDAEEVLALVEQFREAYAERSAFLSMAALRRVVRDHVQLKMDGILVRPAGGMYFVEPRWEDELARLTELVSRFGAEASAHAIPLVDDESQRLLVSRGAAESLVADCRAVVTLVKGRELTTLRLWQARQDVARAGRLRMHYKPLLATDPAALERVNEALDEAQRVVQRAKEGAVRTNRGLSVRARS